MIFRGKEHKVIYTSLIKRMNKPIFQMSPEFLAQDVYEGTDHISFSDLTDSGNINERIYKLILGAVDIKRNGVCAFKLNKKGFIV